jgi:hypothetical protein
MAERAGQRRLTKRLGVNMKVPGWVIGLIVVLLQAAMEFLSGEQFAGLDWAPFVVLALTTIISAIRLYLAQQPARQAGFESTAQEAAAVAPIASWWLKG